MIQINVTLFHIFKENKKVKMLICIDWLLNDFISFFRHDSLLQKFTLNNILHLQINIKKCNNKNNLIKFSKLSVINKSSIYKFVIVVA